MLEHSAGSTCSGRRVCTIRFKFRNVDTRGSAQMQWQVRGMVRAWGPAPRRGAACEAVESAKRCRVPSAASAAPVRCGQAFPAQPNAAPAPAGAPSKSPAIPPHPIPPRIPPHSPLHLAQAGIVRMMPAAQPITHTTPITAALHFISHDPTATSATLN